MPRFFKRKKPMEEQVQNQAEEQHDEPTAPTEEQPIEAGTPPVTETPVATSTKCDACQGTGLKDQDTLCEVCKGSGGLV